MERVVLLGLLPKEGNFLTLRLVRELREGCSFKEKELKVLEVKTTEDGNTTWKTEGSDKIGSVDIKIGDTMRKIIIDILVKLNEDEKLREDLFTLYEKFVK